MVSFFIFLSHFFTNFARMKRGLNYHFLAWVMMLLFAMVSCQGGAPSYDSRLSRADSLLRCNDPDSTLRLLTAIDGAKLSSAGDRAYHALLLTQAQYRCYADITSDSTINVALDYYKRHDGEREKLTRAYIYKGAVMEVLGDAEQAMSFYKQALSVASRSDHFNQGYANLRIGYIYRDYLVNDSADITSLKQALHHFEQVPDSFYVATCLSTIGSSYAAIGENDSGLVYLERADMLIKALNLSKLDYYNQRYLADLKMFSPSVEDVIVAKDIAVKLADKDTDEHDHLVLIAAYTLAKLNKADSARYYLAQVEKDRLSDGLRILYNFCYAELARIGGDFKQFEHYFRCADDIGDSLLSNTLQLRLREVEAKYDNEALKNKSIRYKYNWIISLIGAALFAGLMLAVIVAMRRKLARRQQLLRQSEDAIERLREDQARLTEQLSAHQAMSAELKQTIWSQVEVYSQLMEKHITTLAGSPKRFSDEFERSYRKNRPDNSFWKAFRSYANVKYNDIITRSLEEHPSLGDTDLNFLSLYCCGFPTSVIMACMGYNDAHSVYNKKRRVAEALGLKGKLDDYIMGFKPGEELGVRS